MKFLNKEKETDIGIVVYPDNSVFLLGITDNEIFLYKEKRSESSFCKEEIIDYKGKRNVFVGKTGNSNPFRLKRLQVFQLEESK